MVSSNFPRIRSALEVFDYRVAGLLIKLVMVVFVSGLGGFALWVGGTLIIVSFWFGNEFAVSFNAVLAYGLGAGLGAYFVGPRIESEGRRKALAVLPGIAICLTTAYLGQLYLADILLPPVIRSGGQHGSPQVYGSLVGAVIGSLLIPLAIGLWRVIHRKEP